MGKRNLCVILCVSPLTRIALHKIIFRLSILCSAHVPYCLSHTHTFEAVTPTHCCIYMRCDYVDGDKQNNNELILWHTYVYTLIACFFLRFLFLSWNPLRFYFVSFAFQFVFIHSTVRYCA